MMNAVVVQAEGLCKKYKIATARYRHDTLRDLLTDSLKSAFRRNGNPHQSKDDFWALKNVSFELERGEAVGIIGRNGAGKSTLLRILSRITQPTEGYASIKGRVGSLLEVGAGFHQELTGRENIYLNGAILGMTKREIDRKFDAIVDFSEIGKFIDTPVKRYSSGMYVRLAFSVAAHLDPEIMMIDEVLSVGDMNFQQKCMGHAKRLLDGNATILFVSHNMFAIKAMCSRVIYLNEGSVRYDGPSEEAISIYESDSRESESRLDSMSWGEIAVGSKPSEWSIYATDIQVLDEQGKPRTVFDFGERIRIRVKFETRLPIVKPNFIIAFVRSDNVACCSYSSFVDDFHTSHIDGEGVLEMVTPPLKLVAEAYDIVILVRDESFQRAYCAQRGTRFHIRHELLNTHFGVFHDSADWHLSTTP
ncbi:MAG: ABC transporter ATP-binding protein [Syntrophobacteraceae bacterium]